MSTLSDALGFTQNPEGSTEPSVAINANADQAAQLFGGYYVRDLIADADYELLEADYLTAVLIVTDDGTVLTGPAALIYPDVFPSQLVLNNTAQDLTLKKDGGVGVTLPAGESIRISCGPDDVLGSSTVAGGGGGAITSVNGATGIVVLDDVDVKSPVSALTSGTTVTVDCSLARSFTLTLAHNVGTLTLSNLAGSGYITEIEIEIKQPASGGPYTFALPASFKALGGSDTAIASAADAVTVLSAKTFDNGTTWRYAMQESA